MNTANQLAEARAGRYERQPAGYRAFLPSSLPPDPPVRLNGEIQALLAEANLALGRLDGSIQTLPNPDLFVYIKDFVPEMGRSFKAIYGVRVLTLTRYRDSGFGGRDLFCSAIPDSRPPIPGKSCIDPGWIETCQCRSRATPRRS